MSLSAERPWQRYNALELKTTILTICIARYE
jgi:hypothetical protein